MFNYISLQFTVIKLHFPVVSPWQRLILVPLQKSVENLIPPAMHAHVPWGYWT